MKLVGMTLFLVGVAGTLCAAPVPEIDAGTVGAAIPLLAGAFLVIKGRRAK